MVAKQNIKTLKITDFPAQYWNRTFTKCTSGTLSLI